MNLDLYGGGPRRYDTEDAALARSSALIRENGSWTGVRRRKDGTFSLEYDPWARDGGPGNDTNGDSGA